MKHYSEKERDEFLRREKTYLVIYFRDGPACRPVIERHSAEGIKKLKLSHPQLFRESCILKGEVYKGFGSDFWGMIK